MNWVDWIIIAVIVLSAAQAASIGMFVEVFSLGGVIVGLLAGSWEYAKLAPWFLQFVKSQSTANLAAFLAIFFGIVLLAGVAGRIARWAVSKIGLGFVDRLLGGIFGLIRGAAVVSVSLMALAAFVPDSRSVAESSFAPYFLLAARTATWVAPADIRSKVQEGVILLRGAAESRPR
jgi:membrane protein required for colicin V production